MIIKDTKICTWTEAEKEEPGKASTIGDIIKKECISDFLKANPQIRA